MKVPKPKVRKVGPTDPGRSAAMEQYAKAHDRHAEEEQMFAGQGQHLLAAGKRAYGMWAIRAWLAERDDPQPEGLEVPHG